MPSYLLLSFRHGIFALNPLRRIAQPIAPDKTKRYDRIKPYRPKRSIQPQRSDQNKTPDNPRHFRHESSGVSIYLPQKSRNLRACESSGKDCWMPLYRRSFVAARIGFFFIRQTSKIIHAGVECQRNALTLLKCIVSPTRLDLGIVTLIYTRKHLHLNLRVSSFFPQIP